MLNRIIVGLVLICSGQNALAAKLEPLPIPLEPQLSVELVLGQQEMAVDVPDSSAATAQFGLIGALVGSAIENAQVQNAEKRVVEVRNRLIDYDFNERFEAAARAAVATDGISPDPQVIVRKSAWDAASAENKPETGQKKTVLVIVPRYSMSSNFEQVSISMAVSYRARELKSNGKVKETYLFSRNYSFRIPMDKLPGSAASEDSQRWAALGKERLTALADQGIKQVTEMLAFDFSAEGRALSAQSNKGMSGTFKDKTYNGRILRQTEEYIWVQSGKNWMQTIQGIQPISGPPAGPALPAETEAPDKATASAAGMK
jgi:hypothetical protein